MFVTFSGFSGSLTTAINHWWHLLLHINVLKFHHRVPHSDWCSRLSPYLPHHSPAEYQMNRRSSPRHAVSCINGWSSHCALMTGSDKPVYTLSLNVLFLLQSSPAPSCSKSFCAFCVALLLSHYIVCSSWENTSHIFFPYINTFFFPYIHFHSLLNLVKLSAAYGNIIPQLFSRLLWVHILHILVVYFFYLSSSHLRHINFATGKSKLTNHYFHYLSLRLVIQVPRCLVLWILP